ncbi:MAG: hypothetical protein JRF37_10890 [Deltaproteobacteria bacterium]|nr:hypothetical protein [Deltaproteobacteria bacterium]MBW2318980.1 hypothetical protein [Deltaproteobacteria bacterium]
MKVRHHTLTVALALIAGLAGGVISSQFFIGQPVFAEKKPAHEKVVRAEKFEVVGTDGVVFGVLEQLYDGAALRLIRKDGGALALNAYRSSLELGISSNPDSGSAMRLSVKEDSGAEIRMVGHGGAPSILGWEESREMLIARVKKDANPTLQLHDTKGKVLWSAP